MNRIVLYDEHCVNGVEEPVFLLQDISIHIAAKYGLKVLLDYWRLIEEKKAKSSDPFSSFYVSIDAEGFISVHCNEEEEKANGL